MNKALWPLLPILTFGPALTCISPRIMAPLFVICGIAALLADYFFNKQKPVADKTLLAIFGGIIVYGLISYFWSISADTTIGKAGQLTMTFGLACFMVPFIARRSAADLKYMAVMLASGLVLGLGVYTSEMTDHFVLYDLVHPGNHDVIDNKQNKATVLLSLWYVLSLPFFLGQGEQRKLRLGLLAVATLGVMGILFWAESSTAQMIFMGLPIFALVLFILPARLCMALALTGTLLITIGMPFGAKALYEKTNLVYSHAFSNSIRSRIEIWHQASSRAFEKPVFGWGLDGSRKLPNRGERSVLSLEEDLYVAHLHPHNAPIQIWFELGAIGVAAFCALFVVFYRRLTRLTVPLAQKYGVFAGVATFMYTLAIWGIWQTWFMASLCVAGLMLYAGVRSIETTSASSQG